MTTPILPFVQEYVVFSPVGFKRESITTGNICIFSRLKQLEASRVSFWGELTRKETGSGGFSRFSWTSSLGGSQQSP